jgi:hypothetical protein
LFTGRQRKPASFRGGEFLLNCQMIFAFRRLRWQDEIAEARQM